MTKGYIFCYIFFAFAASLFKGAAVSRREVATSVSN